MQCRYYITSCTDPYRNLAREELLLKKSRPGELLLYLWQNDHTVVIGRNQDAWRECRVQAFEDDGGHLARRLSGGGAVYHDMGNQNFTFFARQQDYSVERNTEVIRLAARKFGIEAVRSGRNDILAEGRKFSGNAFYRTGDYCYHHGTVLVNSDMTVLGRYLNPSAEKLAGKGVTSVVARVVNLAELAPQLTTEAMRKALVQALGEVCGEEPQLLTEQEIDPVELDALTEKYASQQWRLGTPFSYTSRLATRLPFGEIDLQFEVQEGRVRSAKVYSDAMNADWVQKIAPLLVGELYEADALNNKISVLANDEPEATTQLQQWLAKEMQHKE